MSTRATYEIAGQTFYIHTDGYPAGAAGYFASMIEAMTVPAKAGGIEAIDDRRGGALFAFIRGNMRVEPTESHQAHGDTEHRWRLVELEGKRLAIKHSARNDFDHWTAWSSPVPIAQFINGHYPGVIVAIEAPDPHWKREILATTRNAIGIAAAHRRHVANLADGNPNRPRHIAHAEAWEREILEAIPSRVRWLEKEKAETAAELAKGSTWGRDYYQARAFEIGDELEALRAPIGELEAA